MYCMRDMYDWNTARLLRDTIGHVGQRQRRLGLLGGQRSEELELLTHPSAKCCGNAFPFPEQYKPVVR